MRQTEHTERCVSAWHSASEHKFPCVECVGPCTASPKSMHTAQTMHTSCQVLLSLPHPCAHPSSASQADAQQHGTYEARDPKRANVGVVGGIAGDLAALSAISAAGASQPLQTITCDLCQVGFGLCPLPVSARSHCRRQPCCTPQFGLCRRISAELLP